MNKVALILILLLAILIIFQKPLSTHAKILLFIPEQFDFIPFKPLTHITPSPVHQTITLDRKNGKIVMDVFLPANSAWPFQQKKKSAVILAMGVKTAKKDKPIILHFAQSLARLGFVTIWPRLEVLDKGKSLPEHPQTFVESFLNAQTIYAVDPQRISFVGFSVGSSIAMVAVSDKQINDKVHALVFFGGYYDIFEYLVSLSAKRADLGKRTWQPAEGAINHAKEILKAKNAKETLQLFTAKSYQEAKVLLREAPAKEVNELRKLSPKEHLQNFKTRIFILHDKGDTYVPYEESIKLAKALPKDIEQTFLLVNLFEHVQPKQGFSPQTLEQLAQLYGFLYECFNYL